MRTCGYRMIEADELLAHRTQLSLGRTSKVTPPPWYKGVD